MKDLILSLMIAIAPLAGVADFLISSQPSLQTSSFGDLSGMHAIVADTLALAKTGDFDGAEKRITISRVPGTWPRRPCARWTRQAGR